jgi:GntR family transcriptional regulator, vanillate catabolism transcriptional regulator
MTRRTSTNDVRGLRTLKAQMRVRQLILDGELGVGQRIPELNLVERTGVSRTPIRAALLRLAEEGLLEYAPSSGGFIVRAFDESEVYDAIDVRGTLEGAAARRVAERRPSSSELNEFRDCVGAMDALVARPSLALEQFSDYARLNERYHTLLVELAQSPALTRTLERISSLPFASPSAFVLAQSDLPNARENLIIAHDQHRGILDAVIAGEGSRAESIAREHSKLAQRDFRATAQRKEWRKQVAGGNLIQLQEPSGVRR